MAKYIKGFKVQIHPGCKILIRSVLQNDQIISSIVRKQQNHPYTNESFISRLTAPQLRSHYYNVGSTDKILIRDILNLTRFTWTSLSTLGKTHMYQKKYYIMALHRHVGRTEAELSKRRENKLFGPQVQAARSQPPRTHKRQNIIWHIANPSDRPRPAAGFPINTNAWETTGLRHTPY